jgi:hypothetical protein
VFVALAGDQRGVRVAGVGRRDLPAQRRQLEVHQVPAEQEAVQVGRGEHELVVEDLHGAAPHRPGGRRMSTRIDRRGGRTVSGCRPSMLRRAHEARRRRAGRARSGQAHAEGPVVELARHADFDADT